jgi:hypothetical protein
MFRMSALGQAATRRPGARRLRGANAAITMLAAAVMLAASLVAIVARAAPADAVACGAAHSRGVTIVVDFRHFRHGIDVRCDLRRPATGLAALREARFTYTFVPRLPGFICRINNAPRRCNGAPVSAYWSYWHARPHGRWIYSPLGAGSYRPRPGWVEGWAFGRGKPPGISPP